MPNSASESPGENEGSWPGLAERGVELGVMVGGVALRSLSVLALGRSVRLA
jgi:hypothetical protein